MPSKQTIYTWLRDVAPKLGIKLGGKTSAELMEEIECQVEKRYPKEYKQIHSSLSTTLNEPDKTSGSSNTSSPQDMAISQTIDRDQTYPFVPPAKKSRRQPT